MLVAISQRGERESKYGSVDILERSYGEYFDRFDVNLIPVPNVGRVLKKYFHQLKVEGIILSGGGDVHPSLYGGDINYPGNYSSDRDETEKSLLEIALDQGLPVLGICRGMEAINVNFGGKLIQNLEKDVADALNHRGTRHSITVSEDSIVNSMETDTFEVNSYHDLGIGTQQLSSQLIPFAVAEDQTIEGLYHPEHAIAAVMWHPERENSLHALNEFLTNAFISRKLFWRDRQG